jgi:hypothetical protein
MPSTGRFQLTVGTVARAVGRINLLHDWIAPRLRRQRIRERYPFLRLKTKSKEEGRFTLSIRAAHTSTATIDKR